MSNELLTIITLVLAITLVFAFYNINKLKYHVKILFNNEQSLIELLYIMQNDGTIERIEKTKDE